MKKIYTLLFIASITTTQAQQIYSFETSEGYVLGNLNKQNGWEVSEAGDGKIINNQIVTNELASDGMYSLKMVIKQIMVISGFLLWELLKLLKNLSIIKILP